MAQSQNDRDWTEVNAERERVPSRFDLVTKQRREEVPDEFIALETGEYITDSALERLRRFKRTDDVVLFINDDLDDETMEVVEQAFRYLERRLEDVTETGVEAALVRAEDITGPEV